MAIKVVLVEGAYAGPLEIPYQSAPERLRLGLERGYAVYVKTNLVQDGQPVYRHVPLNQKS